MAEGAAQRKRSHFRGKARLGHRVDVSLRRDGEGAETTRAYTRDLGAGGAFIVTEEPLERGALVVVEIALTGGPLVARGEVRWSDDGESDGKGGVGVKFVGLEVAELLLLNEYLDSLTGTEA